jgi:hypothetical protein
MYCVINLNELTLTDENTQSQIDQRELQSGITVPNEVRARKGLPARDGGEHPMVLSAKDQMDQQQATLDGRRSDSRRRSRLRRQMQSCRRKPQAPGFPAGARRRGAGEARGWTVAPDGQTAMDQRRARQRSQQQRASR